ncbi:MAG: alpha/beta fold hydrolase [Clostridium sp.]|uniref:alpha/beta fold hydrolase n=1 Tax=Clostridium sp. TaxID=1506 RepID=UPI003F3770AA
MAKFNKEITSTEEYVDINGIPQYLLHLEGTKENPVLLFLHGGPGSAESIFAHLMQENWDKHYTVVHWDQRGAGKTLTKNSSNTTIPTLELLLEDLSHVVTYLKKKYNKDKIAILGHSWGSVLGTLFIKKYPTEVSHYIGVGQVINMMENERVGYEKVKEEIIKSNNNSDLKKLESLGEYPTQQFDKTTIKSISKIRKLQSKYKLAVSPNLSLILGVFRSPIFKLSDISSMAKGLDVNFGILKYLFENYDLNKESLEYKVPIYYILGDNDWQTPYNMAQAYFEKIIAPKKELFMIHNAGHITMLDKPTDFYKALCKCSPIS